MSISVLLTDDHAIVREGYRALLEKQTGLRVAGEAATGEEAYRACTAAPPDVLVIDLSLRGMSGIECIARLRRRLPELGILVLTMHQDSAFAVQAFRAGANGYVTKTSAPALLVQAVRDVYHGMRPMSPDITAAMALHAVEESALAELSPREFVVLEALVEGRSTETIAEQLFLSPKTVANIHYSVKSKMGVASDIELIRLALRLRLARN
jgi:two-component system invasion response regulator UvrY